MPARRCRPPTVFVATVYPFVMARTSDVKPKALSTSFPSLPSTSCLYSRRKPRINRETPSSVATSMVGRPSVGRHAVLNSICHGTFEFSVSLVGWKGKRNGRRNETEMYITKSVIPSVTRRFMYRFSRNRFVTLYISNNFRMNQSAMSRDMNTTSANRTIAMTLDQVGGLNCTTQNKKPST